MGKTRVHQAVWPLFWLGVALSVVSCSQDSSGSGGGGGAAGGYVQIERLGRPGINEALITKNDLLAAWNAAAPTVDLTDAAEAIRTEATTVLEKIRGTSGAPEEEIVSGFLPGVMRIDTSKTVATTATAYNSCRSTTLKILCGGRKLTDDVIDITLSLLAQNDPTGTTVSDGVDYADAHTTPLTDFPYLAAPR